MPRPDHEQPDAPTPERRRYPRVTILEELHSQFVSLDVPVRTCEMSLGGFSIEAPLAFPVGAEHEFLFTREDGLFVLLTARVMHCRPAANRSGTEIYVTGFEFVREDARTSRAVEDLMGRLDLVPDAI
jgi:hypothetical protein